MKKDTGDQMTATYWEVKAHGDTIYVRAKTFDEAERIVSEHMGREVLPLCTFKAIAALPEGEEAINS